MNNPIQFNPNYSTTRFLRQVPASVVEAEIKAAHKPEDKFETLLFLPEGDGRQGEGGLRTQGYFKKSQEDKPLITVVTVVFNGEKFLEETILSVISQTYDNVEYIIIDGGSTDGTLDIIRKYEHAIDYWVSERDEGIADAFNKGIRLATGYFVGILNAADCYSLDALTLLSLIKSSHRFDVFCGAIKCVEGFGSRNCESKPKLLKDYMSVWHPSVFVGLSQYKSKGLFDPIYKIAMDFDLLHRFYKGGAIFYAVTNILATMPLDGVSAVNWKAGYAEVRDIKIKYGTSFISAYQHFIFVFFKTCIRQFLLRLGLYRIVSFFRVIK